MKGAEATLIVESLDLEERVAACLGPDRWARLKPHEAFTRARALGRPVRDIGGLVIPLSNAHLHLRTETEITPEQQTALELLGHQLALALTSTEPRRRPDETDPVTGLPTRTWFNNAFNSLFQEPIVLVAVELDGFSTVNQKHGRAEGDEVLREVAAFLSDRIRPGDLLCREQCDEFLLGLIRGDKDIVIGEWRENIADFESLPVAKRHNLTMSAGLVGYPEDAASRGELLELAERARTWATRQGRRLVAVSSIPSLKLGQGKMKALDRFDPRTAEAVKTAIAEAQSLRIAVDGPLLLLGLLEQSQTATGQVLREAGLTPAALRHSFTSSAAPTVEFSSQALAIFSLALDLAERQQRQTISPALLLLALLDDAQTERLLVRLNVSFGTLLRRAFIEGLWHGSETLLVQRIEVRHVIEQTTPLQRPAVRDRQMHPDVYIALARARDEAQRMRTHVEVEHLFLGLLDLKDPEKIHKARALVAKLEHPWVQADQVTLGISAYRILGELGDKLQLVNVDDLWTAVVATPQVRKLLEEL